MNYRSIDAHFAVAGQLHPDDVGAVAAAGFKTILCARPDDEEFGQPKFSDVARAADKAGLKAVHIPVSGAITEHAVEQMKQVLKDLPGPIYGFCRSGARAGSLYSAAGRTAS